MNAVAGFTPEQLEVCGRLTPHIVEATEDFFTPGTAHPFLEGLANGGVIHEDPARSTPEMQAYVITEAKGLRDTLDPEKFSRIGIPETVAANGLMWVIMTNRNFYPTDPQAPSSAQHWDKLDHSFAYWDSSNWHVRRMIPDSVPGQGSWEDMWETSELKPDEVKAMQVVVSQTQDLHAIAEQFSEDSYAFERAIASMAIDGRTRHALDLGLKPAINTQPYRTMPAFMHYYSTGYQYLSSNLRVAHRVADGRSFELDSGGLMAANYHRSSMPSTPEMLEDGENSPLGTMHPPVPPDMLRYYRQPNEQRSRLVRIAMDTLV